MAATVYECMFIFNANQYARNPGAASTAIEEIVKSVDGELLASRLWNEQKLVYPIRGQRKGVYWLTYVKMDGSVITKFNRACQLNDMMLRHMVIGIDPRLVDALVAVAKGEKPAEEISEIEEKPAEEADEKKKEAVES